MRNDYDSNYLAHHGILGMKWGKRNGPPYPLTDKMHSAAEKAAGWRKSLGDAYKAHKKKKVQKKALAKARQVRAENVKKEAERKRYEDDKQKALSSGKASDIMRFKGDLTNDQYDKAFKRLEWERKMTDLSNKEVQTGWDKMDDIFDKVGKMTDYVNKSTNAWDAIKRSLKSFGVTKDDKKENESDEEKLKKALNEVVNSRDEKKIKRYASLMDNKQLANAMAGLKTQEAYDERFKSERQKKKEEKQAEKKAEKEAMREEAGKQASDWAKSINSDYEYDDYYDDESEPPKSNSKSNSSSYKAPTSTPKFYNLNDDLDDFSDDEVREIEKKLRKLGYI